MEPEDDGLEVLRREECLELLASASVGRVVFTDGGLPVILPVTFVIDGDVIAFRTRAGSRLAKKTSGAVVAFEVDDTEPALQAGWSVCVCGRATSGPIPQDLAARLVAWAPGSRDEVIRIPLTVVSGRRIRPRPGGTHLDAAYDYPQDVSDSATHAQATTLGHVAEGAKDDIRHAKREDRTMRVLVSAASKHGSTMEIAERIGAALREHGLETDVLPAEQVMSVADYDAVLLGSAVYAGHWLDAGRTLVDKEATALASRPTWLFSSGPIGEPLRPEEDPVDVTALVARVQPREHRVFAGKLDRRALGFAERAIVRALRAPEGDFRDWTAISDWAHHIARALNSAPAGEQARSDPR